MPDDVDKQIKQEPITLEDVKESISANTDAIRELTKAQTQLVAEFQKWRKAGKF